MQLSHGVRRWLLWAGGIVLLNLVVLAALYRGSLLRQELIVEFEGGIGRARLGDAHSEIPLPPGDWQTLILEVQSHDLPSGTWALYPYFQLRRVTADGDRAVAGRRIPDDRPMLRQLPAIIRGGFEQRFTSSATTEGAVEADLDEAESVVLEGTVVHSPTTFPRLQVVALQSASSVRAVWRLEIGGDMEWRLEGAEPTSTALSVSRVDFSARPPNWFRARVCRDMLKWVGGAHRWLLGWMRWLAIASAVGFAAKGARRLLKGGRPSIAIMVTIGAAVFLWPWSRLLFGLILAVAAALGALARRLPRRQLRQESPVPTAVAAAVLLGGATAAAVVSSAGISLALYNGAPHVQDEVSYVAEARALSRGRIAFDVPPGTERAMGIHKFLSGDRPGRIWPWVQGQYMMLYPLLLAPFARFGIEWLLNPLLGGLLLLLVSLGCRRHLGPGVASLAAVFMLVSPFARITSASLMSTATSGVLVTVVALLTAEAVTRSSLRWAVACGVSVGVVVNARPFDGFIAGVGVAVVLAAAWRSLGRRQWLRRTAAIGIGTLATVPAFLVQAHLISWYQAAFTGQAVAKKLGLPDLQGTWHRMTDLERTMLPLNHSGATGAMLLAILLLPRSRSEWFVVLWALLFPIVYAAYPGHGVIYGPRYWFPSLPAMIVLAAIALRRLWQWGAAAAERSGLEGRWFVPAVATVAVAGAVLPFTPGAWTRAFVSSREFQPDYNDYSVDFRIAAKSYSLRNAIVFVSHGLGWQRRDLALCDNTIDDYRGSVLYAQYSQGYLAEMTDAYPNRQPYLLTPDAESRFGFTLYRIHRDDDGGSPHFEWLPDPGGVLVRSGTHSAFDRVPPRGSALARGGLVVRPDGELITASIHRQRVFRWTADGSLLRRIGGPFEEHEAALPQPHGLDVSLAGVIHVADLKRRAVLRFDLDGRLLGVFEYDHDRKKLDRPLAVAALEDGSTLVAQQRRSHLLRIGADGTPRSIWTHLELQQPWGVCRGSDGRIWLWDRGLEQLIGLTREGEVRHRYPLRLVSGHLVNDGAMMAADQHRVVISDPEASALLVVDAVSGVAVRHPAAVPSGVALHDGRTLYLSSENHRIETLDVEQGESEAAGDG